MNPSSPIFWTLIIILALGVLVIFIIRNASRHRKGFAALAKELGFSYEPESPELLEQFKDFRLFLPNRDRTLQLAYNVVKGKTKSATVFLFDYSYAIRGSRFQHDFTICALRSPDLRLPYFYLRHKWLTEMVNPFSAKKGVTPESDPSSAESAGSEIDFPEDEQFTKTFVLQGKEGVVRPLFDVDLRQHLLPLGDIWHIPARVEGYDDTFMLITTGPIEPKAARELVQRTTNLLPLFSQRTQSW